MRVFLFDIDGTLINSRGAGQISLAESFASVFGIDDPQEVPVHGHTDRGIAGNLFSLHGIENSEENWRRFLEAYLERLPENLPKQKGYVLPGIIQILETLSKQDDVAVGLLTGNVRRGAEIKLEYFGIWQHFSFGGYGDDQPQRNDIAMGALETARELYDGRVVADQVLVIGDTPKDVHCARHIGAKVAAIATGAYSREALAAEEPDLLLDDLSDGLSALDVWG